MGRKIYKEKDISSMDVNENRHYLPVKRYYPPSANFREWLEVLNSDGTFQKEDQGKTSRGKVWIQFANEWILPTQTITIILK